ncbi:hypothetical protein PN441_11070 [Spirulina major CS-329]|nr:hypothetical protein [Spirulina subsalsa]MDB9503611.1 hypothetical protein [Spirulina major CS-329]
MMQHPITVCGLGLSALILPCLLQGSPAIAIDPGPITPPAKISAVQIAQAPAETALKLTLADLPQGFIEPPPAVAAQMVQQLEALSGQFQQSGVSPEDFYVYIHPTRLQVVVGFNGVVSDRELFDYYLTQSQQPEQQIKITELIQQRLAPMDGIDLTRYETLETVNGVGDRAAGIHLGLTLYDTQFSSDLVTFRRGNVGLFTAIMYPQDQTPLVELLTLATTLDQRI